MITILVDEAYAFDFLSIIEIKYHLNNNLKLQYTQIQDHIINQIGNDLFQIIINSNEYKNMLKANRLTFEAVDKAKTDLCSASYVDRCNYERHIAKESLQKKFFNSEIKEIKIGYEKYK